MILTTEEIESMTPEQRDKEIERLESVIAGMKKRLEETDTSFGNPNRRFSKSSADILGSDIYDLNQLIKELKQLNIVSEN